MSKLKEVLVKTRCNLEDLIKQKGYNLQDPAIIAISRELDTIVYEYCKHQ